MNDMPMVYLVDDDPSISRALARLSAPPGSAWQRLRRHKNFSDIGISIPLPASCLICSSPIKTAWMCRKS